MMRVVAGKQPFYAAVERMAVYYSLPPDEKDAPNQQLAKGKKKRNDFFQIQSGARKATLVQVMPDDHGKSVPSLPIPNRTVKRLCADDSAATGVKVTYPVRKFLAPSLSVRNIV